MVQKLVLFPFVFSQSAEFINKQFYCTSFCNEPYSNVFQYSTAFHKGFYILHTGPPREIKGPRAKS